LEDLGQDYSRYPPSSPSRFPYSASLLRTTTTNPFSDSQANLEKWGYPDDSIGAFDPYFGGEKGFILYSNEIEADDKFHMPADDDDLTYRHHWKDFDRRNITSTIGGVFLILGLLCLFVVLPVLTFATNIVLPDRYGHIDKSGGGSSWPGYDGPAWAHVNNRTYDLLQNVRTGLIDPHTPDNVKTRISTFDGSKLELVFSDEFNDPNRTFYPGDDPFWTAPNIWYGATQDLEWYDPDAVTTGNGTLQLRLDAFPNHNLQYRSGMLNSWNQLCFKGGVFEVSASLAGPAGVPGLWPGAWTMGNLGRPGYKATTEGVWPYTYDNCDVGITPNQSDPDGLSHLPGQKLNSCTCKGEDHPSPGIGRGAPEIDILEGSVDPNNRIGVVTQSFQVAPFDVYYRPNSDFMQMPNYNTTQMNAYCGGPFQQAVSATTLLNNEWYDGNAYQKYAFEYVPGTSNGKIAWFVGEDQSFMMDGRAIGPNGNVAARQVSEEPMSMVLNLGISGSWSEILISDLLFPTVMHIDYVRLYQKPDQTSVTCDPPGYPTTEYISAHPEPYNNPNLTVSTPPSNSLSSPTNSQQAWNETGYSWPKNTLTGC
jgi:beta-glucanase (GH16 family)